MWGLHSSTLSARTVNLTASCQQLLFYHCRVTQWYIAIGILNGGKHLIQAHSSTRIVAIIIMIYSMLIQL